VDNVRKVRKGNNGNKRINGNVSDVSPKQGGEMKVNHAERVKREAKERTNYCGAEFYDGLVEQAAGYKEAETAYDKATEGLVALGAKDEMEVSALVLDYGHAMQDVGFNAGFELGFQQGALLAAYGMKREEVGA
jgi:hypothetical protein